MLGAQASRLRPLVEFKDEITLVPFSGIQILDFGFNLHDIDLKPSKFIERTTGENDGVPERSLQPLSGDAERDAEVLNRMQRDDEEYSIRPVAALEPYLEKWVPVPVLRLKSQRGPSGEERFDPGPSSWARLRTVELDEPDPATGHTHRVQLALDTTLMAGEQGDHYLAPESGDAEKQREFRLVSDPYDMDWFLRRLETDEDGNVLDLQLWVSDWLKDVFIGYKRAQNPTRLFSEDKLPYLFEHWARYLAYLNLIQKVAKPPKMRFVNTVSARDAVAPVDVDLVLDVGNSRTCGILIESFPGESRVDLARSYPLAIRDLSKPEFYYSGLFPSRAEFAELKLGNDRYASRSGRRNAFLWPSFVRIGPEAVRLTQGEEGTETLSGLSSPKRYLWDDAASKQDWRFHNHDDPNNLPKSVRAAMRHLNEAGDVIAQVEYEEDQRLRRRGTTSTQRAIRPRFSRSSMFGFAMAEIIAHAFVQINDPALRSRRAQSDLPRRLKRVILSMPTATSVQEQAIIRSRTEGALKLVCDVLGMAEAERPKSFVDWDEASCTQLVYLYSEVTQKFDGRIDTFLKLKGRERPNAQGQMEPSLRLACIDIGGGTTDLMITTYRGEANRVLHPEQTFREGFRVAGDDLIHRVISAIILPRIQSTIEAAGGRYVAEKLRELFGGDMGGQDQQSVQRRRQFAIRVLVPLAEAVIQHCEKSGEFERFDLAVADILGAHRPQADEAGGEDQPAPPVDLKVSAGVVAYIEDAARAVGAQDWRLADVVVATTREEVDAISREVFQKVLGNLCEVIDHLGVDIVLLTGRPSRLPAVRSIVEEMMVVPPHRLISMHAYKTGRWYPFRDPVTQKIGDPKSTVAVGGMLIALSENRIPNFKVFTGAFQMRSTARYIGEMDSNGQIVADKVLFADIDTDKPGGGETAIVNIFSPVYIGSRQLPLERWTTTPLYRLDFANTNAHSRPPPIKVELIRTEFDDDDERQDSEAKLRREAMQEAFDVGEVTDGEDDAMKRSDVSLTLHTLGFEDDYWLDAGVFRF
ncbi:virulence factor SrfB [Chachezhania sediminis]|uniref:virulence factor SrfB n=1 Tax=Chachezhania sediminis TaxID=2599291 RepID=UPI00131A9390|nr:virulence factor SrfB [Chachezhania sediminis]